jgi:release factor glutamine methyltransferase
VTVLEVLRGASEYLEKRSIENPRLNAEWLLAHVLGIGRLELYLQFDRFLAEPERAPLRDLIRLRGEGKPLQHLLGSVEFCGRVFACDARALIPRPETEQLVDLVLQRLTPGAQQALDIGTGSGVIAISLALGRPGLHVTATDLSPDALDLARSNARTLGATVAFEEADLLPSHNGPFDLIVANLPYIPTGQLPLLSREVRCDPARALDGGHDGLDIIRRLVRSAQPLLAEGCDLALEIGSDQASAVTSLLESEKYRDIAVLEDYQGLQRFVFARHG